MDSGKVRRLRVWWLIVVGVVTVAAVVGAVLAARAKSTGDSAGILGAVAGLIGVFIALVAARVALMTLDVMSGHPVLHATWWVANSAEEYPILIESGSYSSRGLELARELSDDLEGTADAVSMLNPLLGADPLVSADGYVLSIANAGDTSARNVVVRVELHDLKGYAVSPAGWTLAHHAPGYTDLRWESTADYAIHQGLPRQLPPLPSTGFDTQQTNPRSTRVKARLGRLKRLRDTQFPALDEAIVHETGEHLSLRLKTNKVPWSVVTVVCDGYQSKKVIPFLVITGDDYLARWKRTSMVNPTDGELKLLKKAAAARTSEK